MHRIVTRLTRWLRADSFRICVLISLCIHTPALLLISPHPSETATAATGAILMPVQLLSAPAQRPDPEHPTIPQPVPARQTAARQPAASINLNQSAAAAGPYHDYIALLRRRISLQFCYPPAAREQGLSGNTTLLFTISRDGTVGRINISETSGQTLLDQDAITTVRHAAPFATFPPDCDSATLNVTATFCYEITRS